MEMVTKLSLRRLYLMAGIGILFWGGLGVRLGIIQLSHRERYVQRAQDQQQREIVLRPKRGMILDRNLRVLAANLGVDSFGIHPSKSDVLHVDQLRQLAQHIAIMTGQSADRLLVKLTNPSTFSWLARRVDPDTGARIRDLYATLPLKKRMQVLREVRRSYPFGPVAGQVLGFTNIDGKGLVGLELAYDRMLTGSPGFSIVQVDAAGRQYSRIDEDYHPPTHGADLVLTIDAACQAIAEEALREAVEQHQAKGGMIILVQPSTGDVLAMASEPSYDPNHHDAFPTAGQKLRPITDTYEPGSTFKLVTATAALESGRFKPEDEIFCNNGAITVAGRTIHDHERFGTLTFQGVIEHSSNVGTIKIAQQLGNQRFYESARALGVGSTTGIDLPGEARGVLLNPTAWSATSLPTMAIGYGVSVTALQLLMAYTTVANDGLLMEPHVVKAIIDSTGSFRVVQPRVIRRAMSPKTARTLTGIFRGVVVNGTGKNAAVLGYDVAGKTGTAWKAKTNGRGYTKNYMSSFIGFFPAETPQIAALIVVDEPTIGYYGAQVSAPAFRKMMERIVNLPKSPVTTPPKQTGDRPLYQAVLRPAPRETVTTAQAFDLSASLRHGLMSAIDPEIRPLWTQSKTDGLPGNTVRIPSVIGFSLRQAVSRLAQEGIEAKVKGKGLVVRQIPAPGTLIVPGDWCLLECRPIDTIALISSSPRESSWTP